MRSLIFAAAAAGLLFAGAARAQNTNADAMQHPTPMAHDAMDHPTPAADTCKGGKDAMGHPCKAADKMGHDAMGHAQTDPMSK